MVGLTKRVRRDLSNKKVKKIVKKKLQESRQKAERTPGTSVSFSTYLKPFLYFAVFVLFIFVLYQVTNSINFKEFFSSENTTAGAPEATASESATSPAGSAETEPEPHQPALEPVKQNTQVEVLNGCGVSGIAKSTTDFLRQSDIDVVYMGNHTSYSVPNSRIIDRTGDRDTALRIAEILGIDSQFVETEMDNSKQLEVTIILGKDYKTLKPFQK